MEGYWGTKKNSNAKCPQVSLLGEVATLWGLSRGGRAHSRIGVGSAAVTRCTCTCMHVHVYIAGDRTEPMARPGERRTGLWDWGRASTREVFPCTCVEYGVVCPC